MPLCTAVGNTILLRTLMFENGVVMKLSYLKIILFLIVLVASPILNAQVTRDDIKELLAVQGAKNIDENADKLYEAYTSSLEFDATDWSRSAGESALSGLSMAMHQSRTAGYKNISWMPGFMQDWYKISFATDNVYGKSLTWQKIWREMDYTTDRIAFDEMRRLFKNNYWEAVIAHFLVKNLTAFMVRNEFKSGRLL